MKKLLLLLLALLMVSSLVACDNSAPPTVPNTDKETSEDVTETEESTSAETQKVVPPQKVEWIDVATYNIVRCEDQSDKLGETRPDNIVNFIYDNKIAICGLQEVEINSTRSAGWKTDEYYKEGSHQPRYIADKLTEKTGEQYYWAFSVSLEGVHTPAHRDDGPALYGNALISKYPIKSQRYVQMATHTIDPNKPSTQVGQDNYERRSILIATLDVEGTDLTVIVTHFGLNEDERRLALEMLKGELSKIKTPVIFMGDLNDYHNSAVIKELNSILKPTSTSSKPASTPGGSRIDYIFMSDSISFKDLKSKPYTFSDHYPVLVKIKLPEA